MLNIIKYDNANALEATWLDAEGKQIVSIAYADVQMDLLRADVVKYGGDITQFETLISDIEFNIQPPIPLPVVVPSIVSMRQARLALLKVGLLTTVSNLVQQGSEEDKITWEFSTEIARDFPLVQNMKVPLGLSEEDLDNLFILASTL